MTAAITGGAQAPAPTSKWDMARIGTAVAVLIGVLWGAQVLHATKGYGATASFSLLVGAALGVLFERGRFCFFCILRDWLEFRNSSGMFSILTALAVGSVGYAVVLETFLPNPTSGRLPPDAHIGPVSWVLVAAGAAFGLGMALSGACLSGHFYRLGQGYSRAPLALGGALVGFGLGFMTWQTLYVDTLSKAPVAWLPATLGYNGALLLTLGLLGGLALLLWRDLPAFAAREAWQLTPKTLYDLLFVQRWHPLVTGALVGLVGVFAYLRVEPLGVTAQWGSLSRTLLAQTGILEGRLAGLDAFAGCATRVSNAIMDNGWLVLGLVLAAWAMALLGNRFQWSRLTLKNSSTALIGGVLMGWGAMTALGCTVGTLLSGISAFAVSGWLFALAMLGGVWLGIRLKLHTVE